MVGVDGDGGKEEEEQQLHGARDAVDDVVAHALEDLARLKNGGNDHLRSEKIWFQVNNIESCRH